MPETVVPELIDTPTSSSRFGFAPTVWLQESVVDGLVVWALEAVSLETCGGKSTRGSMIRGGSRRPGGTTCLLSAADCPGSGAARKRISRTPNPGTRRRIF